MSRPLKCSKVLEVEEHENTDRISSLPDELLGYILSFLPTECAVGTSILSTRWRCLHMLTNCLYFCGPDHYCKKKCEDPKNSFEKFVYRVLLFHKVSPIKKFHLNCWEYTYYDDSHLHAWISVAILKGVEQLHLIFKSQLNALPHSLFSCQTIVELKIDSHIIGFRVPESIHMPSLKILHLRLITFLDGDSFTKFVSACPLLQELEIKFCKWPVESNGHVRLSCGALQPLSLKNADSLVTASLLIFFSDSSDFNQNALALMKAVHHVKQLSLLHDTIQYLTRSEDDHMLCYPNLVKFRLGRCSYNTWKYIMYWLANSPRLETLVFEKSLVSYSIKNENNKKWPPNVALVPFSSGVKVIEVSNFLGCTTEFVVLRYLLKNAKVLKKLIVNTFPGYMTKKQEFQACKKLLMLPRASRTCAVKYTESRW